MEEACLPAEALCYPKILAAVARRTHHGRRRRLRHLGHDLVEKVVILDVRVNMSTS